jgi:hypothetical protein
MPYSNMAFSYNLISSRAWLSLRMSQVDLAVLLIRTNYQGGYSILFHILHFTYYVQAMRVFVD